MIPVRSGSSLIKDTRSTSTHQKISLRGCSSRISLRTGRAWTTSPNEDGLRMRTRNRAGLLPQGQPIGEPLRQTRFHDLFLGRGDVVVQPAEFNCVLVQV